MSLIRPWSAPVTTLSQTVLVGVFVATFGIADVTHRPLWELRRQWGSVEQLSWVTVDEQPPRVIEPSLSGPFDLWDGEWWRIPLSNFHHADLLHLLLNLSAVTFFGTLLERRWGAVRYTLLIAGACLTVLLPEYLAGRNAVGYSGVVCAMFGALWAQRDRDPVIAARITNDVVVTMVVVLASMVVLTLAEVLPIANGAHVAGVVYGYLAANVRTGLQPRRAMQQVAFVLAHVGLISPYFWVTHPVWNGKYEWYRADLPGKPRREPDWSGLERAVAADPTLAGVWRRLANHALEQDRVLDAWKLIVQGLAASPSDAELMKNCRMLWRHLCIRPEAEAARLFLQEQFGDSSENMLRELRRIIPPPVLIAPSRGVEPTPQFVVAETPPPVPEWEPPPDRVWPPRREPPVFHATPIPDAVEGLTL